MKANTTVASAEDLVYLLRSLQFWMVNPSADCKENVVQYFLSATFDAQVMELIREFEVAHPFVRVLRLILSCSELDNKAQGSFVPLVQYVLRRHPCTTQIVLHLIHNVPINATTATAVNQNELILAYLSEYTADSVASSGDLDMLKCLYEHSITTTSLACCCATSGHLHCLQYLLGAGYKVDKTASSSAAMAGHLDILQYQLTPFASLWRLNAVILTA